jgi:Ca2+-binding EF-hand superfamily protein
LKKYEALIVGGAAAAACCFFAAAALASPPSDVLKNFGLVGTWSPNCAVPSGTFGASRITYDAPDSGPATFSSVFTIPIETKPIVTMIFEIEDAIKVTNNQIKLIGKYTKMSRTDVQGAPPVDISLRQVTIEKNGSQIRTVDSRHADGTKVVIEAGVFVDSGEQTPPSDKCDASQNRPVVTQSAPDALRAPVPPTARRPAPQANYLLSKLSANIKLADYLKLMNGEFRWADADANGELSDADGVLLDQIAAASFRALYVIEFWRADLDGDGAVTVDELRRVQTYRFHSASVQPSPGKTIEQTIENQIAEIMAADADHDGRVTYGEALSYARSLPYPAYGKLQVRNLMSAVPDGRSTLTLADFDAAVEKMFRDVDANGDGVVSTDELNAYRQSHAPTVAQ